MDLLHFIELYGRIRPPVAFRPFSRNNEESTGFLLKKVGVLLPDFVSLGISDLYVNLLKENGIAVPTPIQEQAIPLVMEGKDVIAQAQTGTGKTFAFVLPILEKIDPDADHIQALIVTPTRELALQITSEINRFLEHREDIKVLAVYGGQDVDKQLKKLKRNVQIVVGTPGRLLDHIRRETIDLSSISFLVLDEADQMLHIGFLNEVETIIMETPYERQTLLFSATIPDEIRSLAKRHLREPVNIQVQKTQSPAVTVKQAALYTTDRAKQEELMKLIEEHRPFLAVIFCRTKRRVSKLYEGLRANGYKCDELHGDLSQGKRERVMESFRKAEIQLLIATDVAARGLDVEGVTHVFNYDIPEDAESYIHRIGRTGRAGSEGLAITLYAAKDKAALESIETDLNIKIKKEKSESITDSDDRTSKGTREQRSESRGGKGRREISRDARGEKRGRAGHARPNKEEKHRRPGQSGASEGEQHSRQRQFGAREEGNRNQPGNRFGDDNSRTKGSRQMPEIKAESQGRGRFPKDRRPSSTWEDRSPKEERGSRGSRPLKDERGPKGTGKSNGGRPEREGRPSSKERPVNAQRHSENTRDTWETTPKTEMKSRPSGRKGTPSRQTAPKKGTRNTNGRGKR